MKCDELKAYTLFTTSALSGQRVYLTNNVDDAIAELKEAIRIKDELLIENGKQIGELKAKLEDVNELIKTARQMLEDAKATAYAESVDAGMRERRLKRALYKACANWAVYEKLINNRDAYEASEYLPSAEAKFRNRAERWSETETKCLKKAEEYK